jgi:hypothetical protein
VSADFDKPTTELVGFVARNGIHFQTHLLAASSPVLDAFPLLACRP